MVSDVVMTENHVVAREIARDSVGMGAYGMDSHNVQRYITPEGYVRTEGNVQVGGFSPYPISYRSIVPRRGEAANLLVPVCLAASHIAYGSIRMEPVFMILGQSAATAAVLAIDGGVPLQSLDYAKLRARLLQDHQVLEAPAGTRRARLDPGPLEGIVIDDEKAVKSEGWSNSRATTPYLGLGYVHDGNSHDGKTTIAFRVETPAAGRYRIRVLYPPYENRASNALVAIVWEGGKSEARINQKREAPWLGPFDLPRAFTVTISNQGGDGYVVVDGLQVAPSARARPNLQ